MVETKKFDPIAEFGGCRFYLVKDLAEALNTTPRNMTSYIRKGKLKAIKVQNRYVISEDNLKAFLNGDTQSESE